jgi:hypothetical protein
MSERDKFEAYVRDHTDYRHKLERYGGKLPPVGYIHTVVEALWRAWQAALANDQRRSVEDMEDAIAGYRVLIDAGDVDKLNLACLNIFVDTIGFCAGIVKGNDAMTSMTEAIRNGRELRKQVPE